MLAFLLLAENLPFLVALGVVAALAVIEIVSLLAGLNAAETLDDAVGLDAGGDLDGGLDGGEGLLGWLGLGRVPLLAVLIAACASFAATGIVLQSTAAAALGAPLAAWLAALAALLPALALHRWLVRLVARVMPRDESYAVSEQSFMNKMATITVGTARRGMAAEARLVDAHGRTHYVMVEPDDADGEFPAGSEVYIIGRSGPLYTAILVAAQNTANAQ